MSNILEFFISIYNYIMIDRNYWNIVLLTIYYFIYLIFRIQNPDHVPKKIIDLLSETSDLEAAFLFFIFIFCYWGFVYTLFYS